MELTWNAREFMILFACGCSEYLFFEGMSVGRFDIISFHHLLIFSLMTCMYNMKINANFNKKTEVSMLELLSEFLTLL